jgi:hypothetical protein
MWNRFKTIFVVLFGIFFAQLTLAQTPPVTTLRPLVSPDLTGFHRPISLARTGTIIDEARGWIYFYGLTHIKGVKVDGIFRSSLKGEIDYTWLPKNISKFGFFALAENGDLVLVGDTTQDPVSTNDLPRSTAFRLLRISHKSGAAEVTQTSIPNTGSERSVPSLSSIAIADNFLYFVVTARVASTIDGNDFRTSIRRFNLSTSAVDATWERPVDPSARILKATANAIYVTFTIRVLASPSAEFERREKVERIGLTNSDRTWSTILALGFKAAAVDSAGRVYLLADGFEAAPLVLKVQRLNANGDADSDWAITRDGTTLIDFLARSSGWLVNDRFVVLLENQANSSALLKQALVSFDSRGAVIANRVVGPNELGSTLAGGATKLFMVGARSIAPLNTSTLRPEATFTGLYAGVAASPTHFMPQADGSLMVAGNFSVWYEGEEYRNYVRFQANGLPDLSQRIDNEIATRFCDVMSQAKRAVLLYYSCEQSDRNSRIFYLFDPSRNFSRVIDLNLLSSDRIAAFHVAADGWLYFLSYASDGSAFVRRAGVGSGAVDSNWSFGPISATLSPGFDGYIASLDIDDKRGVWVGFEPNNTFGGSGGVSGFARYLLNDPAARSETVPVVSNGYAGQNPLRLTKTHAYIGQTRYLLGNTLARDRTWDSTPRPISVDDQYEYSLELEETSTTSSRTFRLSRRPVMPDGALESASRLPLEGFDRVETIWTNPQGDLNALVAAKADYFSGPIVASVFSDAKDSNLQQTVVEFFSPVANRYFITGRAEEQRLLDSYPQLYTRTGMRFVTASSKFRDDNAPPVCRFYSAPARGGSNSHFLGTGDDCAIVNAFKGYVYEGYDFGAVRPAGGACPANFPVAVTRMFNNLGATAQRNHRYATNDGTVNRMRARGWINEGVVFCASSAIDPAQ